MRNKEREIIFNKYNGKCAYCGCELQKGWHIDHLEPIRRGVLKGGKTMHPERNCMDNYMPSCASCNINKHSESIESFRSHIKGYMKHLNEISTQYKIAKRYGLVTENNKEIIFHFELQLKK